MCLALIAFQTALEVSRKGDYFNSITRVIDLKGLDDLLKEKTTNPLVAVSGRVASVAPFNCKDNGPLESVFDVKVQLDGETKFVDGFLNGFINLLVGLNQSPLYLEDGTGRVRIEGGEDAVGFEDILKDYVCNIPKTVSEVEKFFESELEMVWKRFLSSMISLGECSKVLYGSALNTGTSLTFVGEAVRDEAGNLMIQKPPTEHDFMVFSGEGSFDKMVDKLKSNSEFYIFYSKIFGTIALAVAVMYGVDFIRRWKKKKNSDNKKSQTAKSDSQGTNISHL
ncbi:hypothetical protein AALP_AA1G167700 [Arabis alpina]|uniref:RING-type E3 ubiquitin transferase n=1 Tax=Arabis alpina TaxID=50452 RepID=A0A087HNP4_ARAAL|nr:hypothetical protein AALP_AA1G167700 [Arabis alpina]